MLMRATPCSFDAGASPEGPPGSASPIGPACPGPPGGGPPCGAPGGGAPGCGGGPACGFCGACCCPISIGALGCSVGPFPSSVVCARAPMHKTPANIKAKIAKLAKNLFFMSNLPPSQPTSPAQTNSPDARILQYNEKQLPCQSMIFIKMLSALFSR